jgi:spore germination protein YaaH
MYDNALNESYFSYTDMKNIEHKVSIDDPRSILATLQQAFNDNYSGISVWNIDKFCPYLWAVINNCVDIVRTGDKEA